MFEQFVRHWNLTVDGDPTVTQFSVLLPVLFESRPAMLKVLLSNEERTGSDLLAWWDGLGAVQVFDRLDDCLLMERATGKRSLTGLAIKGDDDTATRILCETAAALHAPRLTPIPASLVPLDAWFALLVAGKRLRGDLETASRIAVELLSTQRERTVLHGDLHHGNVLDGEARGWLAIDPKGLIGERAFDFVNILRNPLGYFGADLVRLARQVDLIAATAQIDRRRLLQWTVAFCGLSAVWNFGDETVEEEGAGEASNDLALLAAALRMLET